MRGFLARHLVVESIILFALLLAFWMMTRVIPQGDGDLSELGRYAAEKIVGAQTFLSSFFSETDEASGFGGIVTRFNWAEGAASSGFCGMSGFAGVYVKNSSALSYFVIIPAFLIVTFAYNRSSADSFSRIGRAIFSTALISFVIVITFEVIQLQELQASVVALPDDSFSSEDFDFGCDLGTKDEDKSAASVALFLGNLSAFLGEIRLYLLGLMLWIIGREHADIRRLQKLALGQQTEREPDDT